MVEKLKLKQISEPKSLQMGAKESYTPEALHKNVAIIFGVTGLVGKELAKRLISKSEWKVYGVARNPEIMPIKHSNFNFIQCDLLNAFEAEKKLSLLWDVTHVFWITWASQFQLDSKECCEQNIAMMSNALNSIIPRAKSLKHVSLQTGMKHYVSLQGPFDDDDEVMQLRYYSEESPRVEKSFNFYYVLEDFLKGRLKSKIAWTIHRPGLIMGSSNRTLYNFMGSLCVYGTICKYLNLPFVFGGTRKCWEEICIDGSDSRLVAEQHIWAATNEKTYSIDGQAFNAINGTSFTWKEIWPVLGMKFGVEVVFSEEFWFSKSMADKEKVWEDIVEKEGLVPTKMEDLANWKFIDALFRCPVKILGTREKADGLGFTVRYKTLDSILYWLESMRDEKLIP
ncbi:(S)-8-oxocitronellyl enol synthase CYC2 [Ziziphus jujuba]|uniref:(S)-8-oxocitronellyl enol synthase CYC2 n=1 Tax=Ziziphus jujuba TaxID=326968 RepID=A0A6P3Z7K1_ZIZJJ|nr:(S)-8-oxocitronellyl enol synthase CYC2 [Ziziphus jujuba]